MPPKRFLVHFAESVNTAKIRKMCELMELTEEEVSIIVNRFCGGLNIDQLASHPYNISVNRQRRMVPIIERKMMSWAIDNFDFFSDRQIRLLHEWIPLIE